MRTLLVWITFLALWRFDELQAWKRRRDAEAARMAAVERRGLLPERASCWLVLVAWTLALGAAWSYLRAAGVFAAVRSAVRNAAADIAAQEHASHADLFASMHEDFAQETTELDFAPALVLPLVLLVVVPLTVLLFKPVLKAWNSALALLASLGVLGHAVFMLLHTMRADGGLPRTQLERFETGAHAALIALSTLSAVTLAALFWRQRVAKREDEATIARLERVMTTLDKDGDGEVSKSEFREAFKELFPHAQFEPVWRAIDKDGDGSLSMAELASHFGMAHLVQQPLPEAPKDDELDDMFSVEAKLDEIVEASALSERAGGVISYFLVWDLIATAIVGAFVASKYYGDDNIEWHWRLALYFAKMLTGLFALPFLVFQVPVLKGALTHTKKTGYTRDGNCVAMLSKKEVDNRYARRQQGRLDRTAELQAGAFFGPSERLELWWNAKLGYPELGKKSQKQMDKVNKEYKRQKKQAEKEAQKASPAKARATSVELV